MFIEGIFLSLSLDCTRIARPIYIGTVELLTCRPIEKFRGRVGSTNCMATMY